MKQIKAIVIADDHYNCLGMVRSLGLAKIDVILLLLTQGKSYVDSSKYVNECIKIPHTGEAIITEIDKIIKNHPETQIVLFPLNDFSSQVLDENSGFFPGNILCPNAQGKIKEFANKYYIKSVADECGLCVPQGALIDFNAISTIAWFSFPAIIKPLVSIEGAKSDIAIVHNKSEFEKEISHYKKLGYKRALIEEYIDGENAHMIEVMGARNIDGTIDFAGIISKIREYPIKNGSTSYATIVQSHDGVQLENISNFLNRIKYVGIFDIEYKYANGQAYFIECNFRNGAPGFIFTLNGHNIPVIWIEKNMNVELNIPKDFSPELTFMVEQNDVINMLKGTPKLFTWIKQYINACKIFSYKGDNRPVRKYYLQFIVNQLGRKFRK